MNAKVRNAGELDERGGNQVLKEKLSSSTTLGVARSSTELCGARCLGVVSMWTSIDAWRRRCVSAVRHATAMKSCEISVRQHFANEDGVERKLAGSVGIVDDRVVRLELVLRVRSGGAAAG